MAKQKESEEAWEGFAKEEVSPLKEEEKEFLKAGLDALGKKEEQITQVDALQIVRGYQTYDPRLEETIKAFESIAEWRVRYDFQNILSQMFPEAEKFHEMWKETVYGHDKYGHVLISFKFQDVDTNAVSEIDEDTLNKVCGQKYATYAWHKLRTARTLGNQRYKHSFIIDMAGAGMGVLSGKRRNTIKKLMDIGSDMFPESVWKLYIINTPWLLRGGWAMVKPWVHPVTQAKVNIVAKPELAKEKMINVDGFTLDQLPESFGGTHPGKPLFDVLKEAIVDVRERGGPNQIDRSGRECLANPSGAFVQGGAATAKPAGAARASQASSTPLGTLL